MASATFMSAYRPSSAKAASRRSSRSPWRRTSRRCSTSRSPRSGRCATRSSSERRGRMNIHEYQAKALLKEYGVNVLRGQVAYTPEEAEQAARALGGPVWVVKAQIHAGGRGKGGGVKLARSVEEVRDFATKMLGMTLVTHQTGPEGRVVRRLLVEEGADIKKELYVALVVDRVEQKA